VNAAAATRRQDDYVAFCNGVRDLCDIDLLDYKRGQMERRVRSFADRRGHAGLAHYLELVAPFTYRKA
jgi:chemotaxis protein methyltransferase CheR